MSPRAGFVLLEEIAPRLKAIIPHIKPVGAEDAEELLQDALALAAKMLHDLEERGKTVTPGNVAYYTILHIRSGRRSYSAGRTDVMNAGTQLDGLSSVMSFEEPAGFDLETGEEIPLGDMLAGSGRQPPLDRINRQSVSSRTCTVILASTNRPGLSGSFSRCARFSPRTVPAAHAWTSTVDHDGDDEAFSWPVASRPWVMAWMAWELERCLPPPRRGHPTRPDTPHRPECAPRT